ANARSWSFTTHADARLSPRTLQAGPREPISATVTAAASAALGAVQTCSGAALQSAGLTMCRHALCERTAAGSRVHSAVCGFPSPRCAPPSEPCGSPIMKRHRPMRAFQGARPVEIYRVAGRRPSSVWVDADGNIAAPGPRTQPLKERVFWRTHMQPEIGRAHV